MFVLKIRKYRELKHISQAKLAELSGLSQPYICQLENNYISDKSPTLKTIEKIGQALSINPKLLIEYEYD